MAIIKHKNTGNKVTRKRKNPVKPAIKSVKFFPKTTGNITWRVKSPSLPVKTGSSLVINMKSGLIAKIKKEVAGDTKNERGGVLIGKYSAPANRLFVKGYIPAHNTENTVASVKFTHEAWEGIYKVLDKQPDDISIIGWYHTHPGYGIFLSGMDMFVVNNFFNLPHQISLVIDPVKNQEGIFYWDKGNPKIYHKRFT